MGEASRLLGDDKRVIELVRLAQEGQEEARKKLIEDNLNLVWHIVHRFKGHGVEADDLFQIGVIGLIKAVDRFDPDYGTKLSTYAVPIILGEIQRFFRDDGPIKVSRKHRQLARRVKAISQELSGKLGREPTLGEVALACEVSKEEIIEALDSSRGPLSLFENTLESDGKPITLMDQLVNESEGIDERWYEKKALLEELEKLPERERTIILLRFFKEKSQAEVGEVIGLSQVQISRLEKKILEKLRLKLA